MRIVLSPDEMSKMIVDYLISKGKLENKETTVYWKIDNANIENSLIEFKQ